MYHRNGMCCVVYMLVGSLLAQYKHIVSCFSWALGTISIRPDVNHTSMLCLRGLEETPALHSGEDVLIIIPDCEGTSHDLHPCYFQRKRQRDGCRQRSVIGSKRVLIGRATVWFARRSFYRRLLVWCSVPFIKEAFKMGSITLIVEFGFGIEHFPQQSP